jgi:magnesium transporter
LSVVAAGKLNDAVSHHMRGDFVCLRADQTVAEGLAAIRQAPPQTRVVYFYVIDEQNRLLGVVPTRQLLLSSPDCVVADIMDRKVIAIPASATVLEACQFFALHRLLGFPVVDADGRILGVVDVDLYTGELSSAEETLSDDDLFQLIGVHASEARHASPGYAFRKRFPWLLCNIAGGLIAAWLGGFFELELKLEVALALFIPVVLNLAESVSTQSVSLALESLHRQRPTLRTIAGRMRNEFATALLLGLAAGLVVGLMALAWRGKVRLLFVLLGGIGGGMTCSALVGAAMPNLLKLLRFDPRVAAGPIALASADVITILIYFNLARALLR